MTGAMIKVLAMGPERRARQCVELKAICADRKTRHGEGNMAAQDPREGVNRAFHRWLAAHQNRPCHIGRPLGILPATIHQKQIARANGAIGFFGDAIMHNRPIWPTASDCIKTQIF